MVLWERPRGNSAGGGKGVGGAGRVDEFGGLVCLVAGLGAGWDGVVEWVCEGVMEDCIVGEEWEE